MSFTAEGWAWNQRCPSSAAKAVLVCLGWHANQDGEHAFPSIATICRRTQLVERTVRKALRDLLAAGLIQKRERMAGNWCLSSEYRLMLGDYPPANMQEDTKTDRVQNCHDPLANMQDPVEGEGDHIYQESMVNMQEGDPAESPADLSDPPADLPDKLSVERERKKESESLTQTKSPESISRPKREKKSEPDGFAEFYAAYPRREGRPSAVRAFAKAIKAGADLETLLDGVRRYRFSDDRAWQPLPATWLNDERWKVERPTRSSGGIPPRRPEHDPFRPVAGWVP